MREIKKKSQNKTDEAIQEPKQEKHGSDVICAVCQKTFQTRYAKIRHMRIHSGERPFQCQICHKSFVQKTTLNIHMVKHSGLRQFQCRKCGQSFSQKGNLKIHNKRVHTNLLRDEDLNSKKFNCSQCSCQFSRLASLNGHVTKVHCPVIEKNIARNEIKQSNEPESSNMSSQVINVTLPENYVEITDFDGRKYRVKHDRVNGRRVVYCPCCEKSFYRPADLLRHYRTHTDERPFGCDRCIAKFRTTNALRAHKKSHERLPYLNTIATDQTKRQLIDIENNLNLSEMNYQIVGYFSEINGQNVFILNSETSQSADIPKEPFIQNLLSSNGAVLYDIHPSEETQIIPEIIVNQDKNRTEFTNLTQFLPENSIKQEEPPRNLTVVPSMKKESQPKIENQDIEKKVQIRSDIEEPKFKYLCQFCPKSFKKPSDLNRPECDKTFALKSTLNNHSVIHDENRQAYHCNFCPKTFTSKAAQKIHFRIHTNSLPFKCQYCDKLVRNASNLRKHERLHEKLAKKLGKNPEEVRPRNFQFMKNLESKPGLDSTSIVFKFNSSSTSQKMIHKCPEPECGKVFPKPSLLERHIFIHSRIKNYICDICNKGFNQKAAIQVHMISHTNTYQFKCEFCPAKFKYRSGVASHRDNMTDLAVNFLQISILKRRSMKGKQ
uniref:CSON009993 protein n=1 Tax=Culicoides sonorensis TaxID=179676 RepID=A0A336LGN7_CULSO